ncbi:GNAT family N-acetyltransferase [Cytobacillus spongiae]|uniref:GNAT family N-acetyltransferase n=1 Tax=Cytobacillus spongiae TaxID=2901381 RepID=UPI001F21D814|nr:N-acetyltransferase [Cytobacillus spongiae]UII57889.1 GNAT family N-acetyltransferase [Cytobacillus spongiae]
MDLEIRNYRNEDEDGWVRCRTLSFLDTAYYDHVLREKEVYENPSIELVAVIENTIVGLLDIEYERKEGTVCSRGNGLGGMIWHVAVHPDFRRKGIGKKLLLKSQEISNEIGLDYLEAWTRDDEWVKNWYELHGFQQEESYLHVFIDGEELSGVMKSDIPHLHPVGAFAHYVGEDNDAIKKKFKRTHECFCYKKKINCE